MVSSSCSSIPKMPVTPLSLVTRHVAIIGAGAAGLVTARELRREGHTTTIFERGSSIGGTWIYTPDTEPDPMSQDSSRPIVHSSLYKSLRTNLPREVMGFLDYPFVEKTNGGDRRRFPGHEEVLDYLERFGREFGVSREVGMEKEVVRVDMEQGGKWTVKWKGKDGGGGEEGFDAVVVCNGHYTEPRFAEIPGIDVWPGKQMHSHNYRIPEPFHDQVVVIIGSSASAVDISRDVARFAKEVHIANRSITEGTPAKQPGYDNMWLHSMIKITHNDGSVVFHDGCSVHVDVIMHCTGYVYNFPFLNTNGIVTVDDNRVGPLYKHVFPPLLAPSLSFVGIPWKIVPFPLCELQSKWIAAVLSGRISLPTKKEMMEDVEAYYKQMEAAGIPKRYTHNIGHNQFDYDDWLANECGYSCIEEWRRLMYKEVSKNRKERPESYRDEWDDDHLVAQARETFSKFLS
uniref:Flavin-containing monooxygenase n=1 Tax=Allium sativum TaxID=4682 RepID=A0A0M4U3V7_ALLSA|nr:S-allyl-L-cysteine S-oxygenase [Allium sativum]